MLFYQLRIPCIFNKDGRMHKAYERSRDNFYSELDDINETLEDAGYETKIFMTIYKSTKEEIFLVVGVDTTDIYGKEKLIEHFSSCVCEKFDISLQKHSHIKEITPAESKNLLDNGSNFCNRRHIRYEFDLSYYNNMEFTISEKLLDNEPLSMKKAIAKAHSLMSDETMLEEIRRIYDQKHPHKFQGHPVHYKLSVGNNNSVLPLTSFLGHILYINHRLISRCLSHICDITENCYNECDIETIFKQSVGGTLVIELSGSRGGHENYTTCYERVVEFFAEQIRKYQRNTLFILVENNENPGFAYELISSLQDEMFFVEVKEGTGNRQSANDYLKKLLDDGKIPYTEEKLASVLGDKTAFRPSDIHQMYDRLYRNNLRDNAYVAYKEVSRVTLVKRNHAPKDAYSRLQNMIGLHDVKAVIDDILDTFRAQKMRSSMGLDKCRPNMHMVFTGNPGSAKTTVARLLVDILNSEGILNSGEFVECGRADLVGKYVGWTAPTVRKKFRAARGGILFIDEAYSLVDDRDNCYGDEAISTIVQEMENNRDDTIVVFAGYPDKMEHFLDKNEGLRSRIAFHIDFPNYDAQELLDILHLMMKERELSADAGVDQRCLDIFAQASQNENFGNGRFVRNLLEQAQIKQSGRIMREYGGKSIDRKVLLELKQEDFDVMAATQYAAASHHHMGFISAS